MNFLREFLFNRRRKKRYELFVPLKCICSCKELKDEGYLGYILNVSKTGVLVVSKYKFVPRTSIKLTFQLPEKDTIFSIDGIIERVSERNIGDYSIGVRVKENTTDLLFLLEYARKNKI